MHNTTAKDTFVLCYLERQLDELEFASSSAPSQTQLEEQLHEEQQHLESILTSLHPSPIPLLLPTSSAIVPSTYPCSRPTNVSLTTRLGEPHEDEAEVENHLHVNSFAAAPLSPTMPLNATYLAHRSIPLVTQLPSSLLDLSSSTIIATTVSARFKAPSCVSCLGEISNLEANTSDISPLLAPMESISMRDTSLTKAAAVQTRQCSVSTQTSDDHSVTHHHCNDVSECPCVQIYTRSEQLFMASMALFFRNSIPTSSEAARPSLPSMNNLMRKNNRRQPINHPVDVPRAIPTINEVDVPQRVR